MADPTAQDYQSQILIDLNIPDTDALAGQMSALWNLVQPFAGPSLYLQYLLAKRAAIDVLLGRVWEDVDSAIPGDMSSKESQKTSQLRALRADVEATLDGAMGQASASQGVAAGVIQTATPPGSLPQYPGQVDANDPRLRGTPYGWPASPWRSRP